MRAFILIFYSFLFIKSTSSVLLQVSSANKENFEMQKLKAYLIPCNVNAICTPHVEIKLWLNGSREEEIFLLIDEVFNLRERTYSSLLHPYLVQVSTSEAIVSYPLQFEQLVDVPCSGNDVQRREAFGKSKDFSNTEQSYDDLLNAIKKEEAAIKKDYALDNGTAVQNENDLLLYFDDIKTTPSVNVKNVENMQRQHDNLRKLKPSAASASASASGNEIQIKVKDLPHYAAAAAPHYNTNVNNGAFYQHRLRAHGANKKSAFSSLSDGNDGFRFIQMETANPIVDSDRTNQRFSTEMPHSQHNSRMNGNRFSINQQRIEKDNVGPTGVINHHHHQHRHKLYVPNRNDNTNHPLMNENDNHSPNEIDIRVKFGNNQHVDINSPQGNAFKRNEIQLSTDEENSMRKTARVNHKFSFDDSRNAFIDLYSDSLMAKSHTAHSTRPENNKVHDDRAKLHNGKLNGGKCMYVKDLDESSANIEPIDNEDDPNLLIEQEMNENVGNDANHDGAFMRKKRSDLETHRYSIYQLGKPFSQFSIKLQVFRKFKQAWLKIHSDITISNKSMSYKNKNFHARGTRRQTFSHLFNQNHSRVLLLNNDRLHSSLMTFQSQNAIYVPLEEIEQSICNVSENRKRSIMSLQSSGLIAKHIDAITTCPSSVDQLCLNLRDDDDDAWSLKLVLPFSDNEALDRQSPFVKISNIFTDTSDGVKLFTQFELTSIDHLSRDFNLSLSECEALKHLNVSYPLTLPPNKSMLINMTLSLPFFTATQHKEQKCKASVLNGEGTVVAQREFLVSPRNERCLCLWMCKCFCFDYFLTAVVKDLCHEMSTRNEIYAGFVDDKNYEEIEAEMENEIITQRTLILLPLMIVLIVLLLGCVKGLLGCCFKKVDMWKFNYVQSCKIYRESSRAWKFSINSLFFFLYPIVACLKCCSIDEDKVTSEDSIFARSIIQKEEFSDDSADENDSDNAKLLKSGLPSSDYSSIFEHYRRSSETIFDATNLRNPFEEEAQHDETLINDTEFIVNAINESHESLRKLSHHSDEEIVKDSKYKEAERVVKEFLAARTVYRRFNEPIGHVRVNDKQAYTIRGYFIPAQSTGYQFLTYNPIKQFYEISSTLTLVALAPQTYLDSKAFRRFYANKIEVLEANDLSLQPSPSAPCINILVQDRSMYGL